MARSSMIRFLLAFAALVTSACHDESGGGGAAGPSFGFEVEALWANEGDDAIPLKVVLRAPDGVLAREASVDVVDLGLGTATSGLDHAGVAPARITFAAGSADGAIALAWLDPLDDDLAEASHETVQLGLRPVGGGTAAGSTRLTVTLVDADAPEVSFASAAQTAREGSSVSVAVELDYPPGVTLQVDVGALVSDLGLGTARPGDYAPFQAHALIFPAGSADGSVATVELALLDDSAPEVFETLALGLAPTALAGRRGALRTHVLTIEDDDLAGPAAFHASAGPTGIEDELLHDDLLALGSDAVGGPPGPGTRVRVANLGGEPMALGGPELFGRNGDDFTMVVESSSLGLARTSRPARHARVATESTAFVLAERGEVGRGRLLSLEPGALARVSEGSAARLHGVPLPALGAVTLELVRRPLPLAPDARLAIDGQEVEGGPRALLGDLQLWSGCVANLAGSRVFLALDGRGAQGFVSLPEPLPALIHLVPEGPGRVRLVDESELGSRRVGSFCGGGRLPRGRGAPADPGGGSTAALRLSECRLALETDVQLFETLGSSSTRTTGYVTSLIAAVSEQFATDVQTVLAIAYLGLHTTADDGWSSQETEGANHVDLLYEFQAAWEQGWPAEANLAHFLSGDRLGGGAAFLNGLCSEIEAYGVSANINGRIDWSAWTGAPASFVWDFKVVAHELGHNFGAEHTHEYCPPIDECAPVEAWGSCQDEVRCQRGTIMSYCDLDCGDLANIDLSFHPVNANWMRLSINHCLGPAALSPGDYVQYRLRFDPRAATGARSAQLTLRHDALNARRPVVLRLSGQAE